jgi:hypothetical protein
MSARKIGCCVACFNEKYKHAVLFLALILSFVCTCNVCIPLSPSRPVDMVFLFIKCSETYFIGKIQDMTKFKYTCSIIPLYAWLLV